jgi:hypothetical protein
MTFEELAQELDILFSGEFSPPEAAERKELRTLGLPDGFAALYERMNPKKTLLIGRFRLLPLKDLIDENIWDTPGETLFPLGWAIAGWADDDQMVCLNLKETNKTGRNDVFLAPRNHDFEGMDFKTARAAMQYLAPSLEEMLTKEIGFVKKARTARQR